MKLKTLVSACTVAIATMSGAPAQAQVDLAKRGDPAEPLGHVLDPQGLAGHQVLPARRSRDR